jgi:hypothetical protein
VDCRRFFQTKTFVIGTPKTIGQAKITGTIIEKSSITQQLHWIKLPLFCEENVLVPLLYSLPSTVGALNITMGYSSKNNPAQILIAKLFKMHTMPCLEMQSYLLYYKDVLDTHPLVEPYAKRQAW